MSLSFDLLRIIGSPYAGNKSLVQVRESIDLFDVAFKNRVELLYLQKVKENGQLHQLTDKYENLLFRHRETLVTVERIAELLNSEDVPYVIIKTLRLYPAAPNDVDILFMGPKEDYDNTVNIMKRAGYVLFEMAPGQGLFCDPRGVQQMRTDKKGGIYYLDLYKELSVQYFTYMDKRNLKPYVESVELGNGVEVKVLAPEIELSLLLMHSVFPSQRYELEMFYTTLYTLKTMNADMIKRFINFSQNNHIAFPVSVMLEMTRVLHENIFGTKIDTIDKILSIIGRNQYDIKRFMAGDHELPYEFAFLTFLNTFLRKLNDRCSLFSLRWQIAHLLNPRFAWSFLLDFVVPTLRERRHRHI